ncbi:sensor histidine kinase [Aeromicrobium sp. CTD01-1L150]|uniref:sensor histidine kinase n=1 Tax=Aeromicrobium sp. CTD01-1L150 TaxID=3341830 RepID=UPI0035C26406
MNQTLTMEHDAATRSGADGSDATAHVSLPRTAPVRRRGVLRRTVDDTAYAIATFPLCVAAFVLVLIGVVAGSALAWLLLGLPILALTAFVARGFAHVERLRLRSQQGRAAPIPVYLRSRPGDRRWRRILTPLRDPQSWLDILWCLLSFVTGMFVFVLAFSWWVVVANGFTYWFWQRWLPDGPGQQGLAELIGLGETRTAEIWLNTAIGLTALLLAPLVMRFAALLHASLADVMLSSRASLQAEVRRAAGGRDSARQAEATSLRRLERDIHDGPQQRLVRLAMDLGRVRHQLDQDPERAREALDVAYGQARDAIDELRALSRGIAPPLLVDRGLGPALEELVARHDEQVSLRLDPSAMDALAPHVETCVYFVVAEAMTNVAKHSRADHVEVLVARTGDAVVAEVTDDGVGGAHPGKGTGLAGLQQRVRGLDGTLAVTSPPGGPTIVRMEMPMGEGKRS